MLGMNDHGDSTSTGEEPEDWKEGALCAQIGPDFFFPEPGGSVQDAKRVCRSCPSRRACLEHALARDERYGVWGGLSEKERGRLRRLRRA
ncbi:WhiB family transcriptional regulator [Streptomyces sp. P6-2-1]|uniref:WhiB family transcriptional regulator n=1 Tax=unclassified Streptomyces TaxID=2593676 RepID=UPI003D364734